MMQKKHCLKRLVVSYAKLNKSSYFRVKLKRIKFGL